MATKQRKFKVGDRVRLIREGTVEEAVPQEVTGIILYRIEFDRVSGFSTMCHPSDMEKINDGTT